MHLSCKIDPPCKRIQNFTAECSTAWATSHARVGWSQVNNGICLWWRNPTCDVIKKLHTSALSFSIFSKHKMWMKNAMVCLESTCQNTQLQSEIDYDSPDHSHHPGRQVSNRTPCSVPKYRIQMPHAWELQEKWRHIYAVTCSVSLDCYVSAGTLQILRWFICGYITLDLPFFFLPWPHSFMQPEFCMFCAWKTTKWFGWSEVNNRLQPQIPLKLHCPVISKYFKTKAII